MNRTPLINAASNGHKEIVLLLLKAGANPRVIDSYGDSAADLVQRTLKEIGAQEYKTEWTKKREQDCKEMLEMLHDYEAELSSRDSCALM